jgi:hypothetical protein
MVLLIDIVQPGNETRIPVKRFHYFLPDKALQLLPRSTNSATAGKQTFFRDLPPTWSSTTVLAGYRKQQFRIHRPADTIILPGLDATLAIFLKSLTRHNLSHRKCAVPAGAGA